MNTVNQLKFSVWEIIKRFARVSLLRIFPAVNQSLSYGCYNNRSLDNAWSRTKVVANQFIGSKLRNKVVTNKSLCTVCASTVYTIQSYLHSNFYHSLNTQYTFLAPHLLLSPLFLLLPLLTSLSPLPLLLCLLLRLFFPRFGQVLKPGFDISGSFWTWIWKITRC